MMKTIRFVGLDVHQKTIVVAVAEAGSVPAQVLMTVANDRVALTKCLDRVGPAATLRVCYEAGPTGYGLARWLNESGIHCTVVAAFWDILGFRGGVDVDLRRVEGSGERVTNRFSFPSIPAENRFRGIKSSPSRPPVNARNRSGALILMEFRIFHGAAPHH